MVDQNGGGIVLFDEFADFCLRNMGGELDGNLGEEEDVQSALDLLKKQPANLTTKVLPTSFAHATYAMGSVGHTGHVVSSYGAHSYAAHTATYAAPTTTYAHPAATTVHAGPSYSTLPA